jgi:hypothetical protein
LPDAYFATVIKTMKATTMKSPSTMRTIAGSAIFVIGFSALTAAPVQAQTYDPNYPVCLQTYGIDGNVIECGYTSLAQCAQSASGRAAQCITNPYFAGAPGPAGPKYRRHPRSY